MILFFIYIFKLLLLFFNYFFPVWKSPASIFRNSHHQISLCIKNLSEPALLPFPLPLTPSWWSYCCFLALWLSGVNSAPHQWCYTTPMMCILYLCISMNWECGLSANLLACHALILSWSAIRALVLLPVWVARSWKTRSRSDLHVLLPTAPRWNQPKMKPWKYESRGCWALSSSCSAQQICSHWHALLCNV